MLNGCRLREDTEFYVAIDNKGLWPHLVWLPDGDIGAMIYNHPSHGYGSGSNVELWSSNDQGCSWSYRSTVSQQPADNPDAICMLNAVGLNNAGELVVLVTGYQAGQKLPLLPIQACVSKDHGITWRRKYLDLDWVPYGSIVRLPNGEMLVAMYKKVKKDPIVLENLIFSSTDHGMTWKNKSCLGNENETHLLVGENGTLLAACRTACDERYDGMLPHGSGTVLYRSEDYGSTWDLGRSISPQGQENAHLLKMRDGRILCCFTSRIPGLFGVVFRISEDMGRSWSTTDVLISISATDWLKTDCGYPSSVQLEDDSIVTAYYFGPKQPEFSAHTVPWHQRYHMGVARWRI